MEERDLPKEGVLSEQELQTRNNRSEKGELTVKKILVSQLFLLPLISLPFALFLFFFWIIRLLAGEALSVAAFVMFHIVTALISGMIAFFLTKNYEKKDGRPFYVHMTALFAPLAFALLLFGIVYAATGDPVVTSLSGFAANPFFFCESIVLYQMDESILPTFLLVSLLAYETVFFLRVRHRYCDIQKQGNRMRRTVYGSICLLMVCCLSFVTVFQIPEIAYKNLSAVYGRIAFHAEEDGYDLYTYLPFYTDGPAELDHPATLQFEDLTVIPRLDGTEMLYPLYSAYVQATYSGLGDYIESLRENNPDQYERMRDYLVSNESQYQDHPLAASLLSCSGGRQAYERLIQGKVDMIFGYEPTPKQIAQARESGLRFSLTKIGYDALCFFVHADNPVQNIDAHNLRDVYAGGIKKWNRLGGKNQRIFALTSRNDTESGFLMQQNVMQGNAVYSKYEERALDNPGSMLKAASIYEQIPSALGYTLLNYSSNLQNEEGIKYLSVNGVMPSIQSVSKDEYAYRIPIYAITLHTVPRETTSQLLKWITGNEGMELLQKTGFIVPESSPGEGSSPQ